MRLRMIALMLAMIGLTACGGSDYGSVANPSGAAPHVDVRCQLNEVRCVGDVLQICVQPHPEDPRIWIDGVNCADGGLHCDVTAPWGCRQ